MSKGVTSGIMDELSEEERAALLVLLDCNGLTLNDLCNGMSDIGELEMFLHEYPQMRSLHMFPALTSLRLIQQGIQHIEGLDRCTQLQKLWLPENRIRSVGDGVAALSASLRELYLYSNRLTSMTGLAGLSNLEILWLSDNHISRLEGLGGLPRLKELSLARNCICSLAEGALAGAPSGLRRLNLADNALASLQEVAHLTCLPALDDLCLADPAWGECPVATLCNYQTYVLYLLPELTSLDTLVLAPETKVAAQSTFAKKRMYYNMRIKSMARQVAAAAHAAREGCQVYEKHLDEVYCRLAAACKCLEAQLSSREQQQQLHDEPRRQSSADSLAVSERRLQTGLQDCMHQLQHLQAQAQVHLSRDRAAATAAMQAAVDRLLVELHSAGNVRVEEGGLQDGWNRACRELVASRLSGAADKAVWGITGIKVRHVSRLHNRHLRMRFERHTGRALSDKQLLGSDKKASGLEYLLLGEHPLLPGHLQAAAWQGFHPPDWYAAKGLDGALVLHNSVGLADQLRLKAAVEVAGISVGGLPTGAAEGPVAPPAAATGRLLVCKAALGAQCQEAWGHAPAGAWPEQLLNDDGRVQASACLNSEPIHSRSYPSCTAVYRTRSGDEQQRTWYVFDPELVLPEFLVEFEYELDPSSPLLLVPSEAPSSSTAAAGSGRGALASTAAAEAALDALTEPAMRPVLRPLAPWLALRDDPAALQLSTQQAQLLLRCEEELERASTLARARPCAPVPPQRLVASLGYAWQSLPGLRQLSLHGCGLEALVPEVLAPLINVRTLVLSFNRLTSLEGLQGLGSQARVGSSSISTLVELDASHNQLVCLDGQVLSRLGALTGIMLDHNSLDRLEDLRVLRRAAPALAYLDLRRNPVCALKGYTGLLLRRLPALVHLDGARVASLMTAGYLGCSGSVCGSWGTGVLSLERAEGRVTEWHATTGVASDGDRCHAEGGPSRTASRSAASWWQHAHTMNLSGCGVRRLPDMVPLASLVVLDLSGNELVKVGQLAACSSLKQLNLSDNCCSQVDVLACLTGLQRLELDSNQLTSLAALSSLTALTHLSAEGNSLVALEGVDEMASLMELYLAGNALAALKDLRPLKLLHHLVILDVRGNPVAATGSAIPCGDGGGGGGVGHRLYCLYHLRRLKVLDGAPADAAELAAARARYSGLLTQDFLEEQLGSAAFDHIRSLDISGLRIRDTGSCFTGTCFSGLQDLLLDNNHLTGVTQLSGLRSLQMLSMNGNRLGEGEPGAAALCTTASAMTAAAAGTAARCTAAAGAAQPRRTTGSAALLGGAGVGALACAEPLLPFFTNLQALRLAGNGLTSLATLALGGLAQLRSLVLSGNELQRLEGLQGLNCLTQLLLDGNKIRQLDPESLAPLPGLLELSLDDNCLRSLAHLATATPGLRTLGLGGNRLVDPSELDRLAALTDLTSITLAGNLVARKQLYRPLLLLKLPQIEVVDGVAATAEEKDAAAAALTPPQAGFAAWTGLGDGSVGLGGALDGGGAGFGGFLTAAAGPLPVATAAGQLPTGGGVFLGGSSSAAPGAASSYAVGNSPAGTALLAAGRLAAAGKLPAALAAVASGGGMGYEALLQAAQAGLHVASSGVWAPQASVPSIQSGTVVLSGDSAFALSGQSLSTGAGALGAGGRPDMPAPGQHYHNRRTTGPAAFGSAKSSGLSPNKAARAGRRLTVGGGAPSPRG